MSELSVIAVSLLAAVGIIHIAISVVELLFREDMKNSVTIIKGNRETAELLRLVRRYSMMSENEGLVVVCDREEKKKTALAVSHEHNVSVIEKSELCETIGYYLNI